MTAEDLSASTGQPPERPPRPIVVHYHFFKNAGTSVDRTLQASFGATWASVERDPRMAPHELRQFLMDNPWVTAVSSHTAMLPAPNVDGLEIIPVLFLRHPLDRVRSIYDFERRQDVDAPAPNKAKETSLAGYVEWRLDRADAVGDHSIADFQVHRLAPAGHGSGLSESARDAVDRLPFVGVVEEFRKSVQSLTSVLAAHFPSISLSVERTNVTPGRPARLGERMDALRDELGPGLFERLAQQNRGDHDLWMYARARYRSGGPTP